MHWIATLILTNYRVKDGRFFDFFEIIMVIVGVDPDTFIRLRNHPEYLLVVASDTVPKDTKNLTLRDGWGRSRDCVVSSVRIISKTEHDRLTQLYFLEHDSSYFQNPQDPNMCVISFPQFP